MRCAQSDCCQYLFAVCWIWWAKLKSILFDRENLKVHWITFKRAYDKIVYNWTLNRFFVCILMKFGSVLLCFALFCSVLLLFHHLFHCQLMQFELKMLPTYVDWIEEAINITTKLTPVRWTIESITVHINIYFYFIIIFHLSKLWDQTNGRLFNLLHWWVIQVFTRVPILSEMTFKIRCLKRIEYVIEMDEPNPYSSIIGSAFSICNHLVWCKFHMRETFCQTYLMAAFKQTLVNWSNGLFQESFSDFIVAFIWSG